ncbi:MAG: hypothetical protein UR96_C0027G0004 [candidate division WS6 bacterium GW2011_GWC1_36_11]|uniref:DUF4145 domain-containing protein n=2 Tax=Candidatus Dojkabacteria TaxID=74243 RepID=A0A0G0DEF0_9BACT|nr:MAG: hypothetical protein UR96_C0027G0004 [candidate division WS6 bacterium GW2011_GWC1_36_11]KKQ03162.1 MAG: hypothetical protein US14_C0038G0002 [candidate division WS6 bacterium GW2011_WS6_36_26]KKQ17943.1 MAG: hypothetical protein US29_C0002G0003 [candidate division WS6 bacterium GW2011_GWF1_36_8]
MNEAERLEEIKTFIGNTKQSEELSFILISVLVCEKYIDEIIESMLINGKYLTNFKESKLYLFDKMKILKATGKFPERTYNMILGLNNLRNKFAHEISYSITEKDISTFGKYMGEKYFKIIEISRKTNLEKMELIVFFTFGHLAKILEYKEEIKLK